MTLLMVGTAGPALSMEAAAATAAMAPGSAHVHLVVGIGLVFLATFAAAFGGLTIGRFVRPKLPHPEKAAAYECGEPTIGPCWVQFDLRFYTVALVFIVFDVEIALLWPWSVVFKEMGAPAFWAFLVFFLLIAVPFAYEWKSGYLDWVRAFSSQRHSSVLEQSELPAAFGASHRA